MAPVWELHFKPRREAKISLYLSLALKHYANQISNQSLGKVVYISPNM